MKLKIKAVLQVIGFIILINLLSGCNNTAVPTETPKLELPTSPAPTAATAIEIEAAPTKTTPSPTKPTAAATAAPPTHTPTATATTLPSPTPISSSAPSYAVVFVQSNDSLNVRSGPGVGFSIVGTLPPTANDVQIIGTGQLVSGSTWVPVQRGTLSGWVNGRFLTEVVPSQTFCNEPAITQLLDQLKTAVANRDDALFAQLIHPERGLRVRLLWHEAETRLDNQNLLSDPTSYNWGIAAGSGEAIIGSPGAILLPQLETDLLTAIEVGCNELLHGSTAGFVRLPDEYAPINFYTFYRPGSDEFAGLNWGSWAVGLEKWQGRFYLSTLVHFQWEP